MEGSKWSSYTTREQFTQEDVYLTEAQVLKEECFNEANAQAKIKYAESLGEGVDEDGKRRGWYRDETRQNAPVYYYARNMVHAVKLRDDKKLATKQSTGNMAIKGNGVLSLPSEPGTVPKALCAGAWPKVLKLATSDTGTVMSETNTSESAKGNGVLSLPSEPGTVPKALGVGQRCGSAASSTEPGPVPKALNSPETGTGGQPDTKSACTEQTNTKDSEAPEANTSPEDLAVHAREVCISTLETLRIENNYPCYTDSKNNIVVGTFIDRPSDDGMAQAEFTDTAGTKQIVELPFLTYKEYKDDSAIYCKPTKKRKGLSKNRRRLFKKGKAISKKAGKVTKKPAAHQKGPTGPNIEEAGTTAHEEAGTKPFRPHQYFLLKRPAGISNEKAKRKWKAMTAEEKTQYGHDTWAERRARKP